MACSCPTTCANAVGRYLTAKLKPLCPPTAATVPLVARRARYACALAVRHRRTASTVGEVAAGTFLGVVAAVFLGIYPIVNIVLRGVTGLALTGLSGHLVGVMQDLELPYVSPDALALSAAVAILVLVSAAVLGLGAKNSLFLVRLVSGFVAGFVPTALLLTTFLALPPTNLSPASLLPTLVAAAGVCIVLASALETAATPQ